MPRDLAGAERHSFAAQVFRAFLVNGLPLRDCTTAVLLYWVDQHGIYSMEHGGSSFSQYLRLGFRNNGSLIANRIESAPRPDYDRDILGIENTKIGGLSFYAEKTSPFSREQEEELDCLLALLAYCRLYVDGPLRGPSVVTAALGEHMKRSRQRLGLTQTALAERARLSRISLSQWEAGRQVVTRTPLTRWCEALDLMRPARPSIVLVPDIGPELLRVLRQNPAELHRLSPQQFELFIAERLDRMGLEVRLTGNTNRKDGGIDLIAVPRRSSVANFLIAGQLKHHRTDRKTGRPDVDRLLSWRNQHFSAGLLVTNTTFTGDALWLAAQDQHRGFLRLRGFEDLTRWLVDNFWDEAEYRELPHFIELAPGIRIEVPSPGSSAH